MQLCRDDTDYDLVGVICHIRLNRLEDAVRELGRILERAPTDEKALFHLAYCYRENGRLKDAVYALSKVSGCGWRIYSCYCVYDYE